MRGPKLKISVLSFKFFIFNFLTQNFLNLKNFELSTGLKINLW